MWRTVFSGCRLWITTIIKRNKEYKRINKEYNQYEKEAELALASEIDAVKGNSLKKELVKRRLVREYIEKPHPGASRNVSDSKFDNWYRWLKTRANKQYTEKCERVFRKCMIWLIINIVAMALLWSRFIGFSLTDAQMILEDDCEKIAIFTGIYFAIVYFAILVVPPILSIIGSRKLYNYTKKQIK